MILAFKREKRSHHPVRDVAAHVGGVVVAAANTLHGANDLKGNIIQNNGCANSGTSREQVLDQFVAQNDDIAPLTFIQTIKPASLIDWEITDLAELRLHSCNLSIRAGELTDRAHIWTNQHGSSIAHMRRFLADVEKILICEQVIARGAHVALDNRSAAGKDEHDVLAILFHLALVARTKTFAKTDQQQ